MSAINQAYCLAAMPAWLLLPLQRGAGPMAFQSISYAVAGKITMTMRSVATSAGVTAPDMPY
jgi:hypothetical protein